MNEKEEEEWIFLNEWRLNEEILSFCVSVTPNGERSGERNEDSFLPEMVTQKVCDRTHLWLFPPVIMEKSRTRRALRHHLERFRCWFVGPQDIATRTRESFEESGSKGTKWTNASKGKESLKRLPRSRSFVMQCYSATNLLMLLNCFVAYCCVVKSYVTLTAQIST